MAHVLRMPTAQARRRISQRIDSVSDDGALHDGARFGIDQILSVSAPGVVVPEVLHSVAAHGAVRFYVEFYRAEEIKGA